MTKTTHNSHISLNYNMNDNKRYLLLDSYCKSTKCLKFSIENHIKRTQGWEEDRQNHPCFTGKTLRPKELR